jgi:hypothetical protein
LNLLLAMRCDAQLRFIMKILVCSCYAARLHRVSQGVRPPSARIYASKSPPWRQMESLNFASRSSKLRISFSCVAVNSFRRRGFEFHFNPPRLMRIGLTRHHRRHNLRAFSV